MIWNNVQKTIDSLKNDIFLKLEMEKLVLIDWYVLKSWLKAQPHIGVFVVEENGLRTPWKPSTSFRSGHNY